MTTRYDTSGNVEAQFQPGSGGGVLANKLGVVELILIHPFREGNGRLSRLLANVMALQAGWPELDYTTLDKCRNEYFAAIQAGMSDYEPMKGLVRRVLRETAESADG